MVHTNFNIHSECQNQISYEFSQFGQKIYGTKRLFAWGKIETHQLPSGKEFQLDVLSKRWALDGAAK